MLRRGLALRRIQRHHAALASHRPHTHGPGARAVALRRLARERNVVIAHLLMLDANARADFGRLLVRQGRSARGLEHVLLTAALLLADDDPDLARELLEKLARLPNRERGGEAAGLVAGPEGRVFVLDGAGLSALVEELSDESPAELVRLIERRSEHGQAALGAVGALAYAITLLRRAPLAARAAADRLRGTELAVTVHEPPARSAAPQERGTGRPGVVPLGTIAEAMARLIEHAAHPGGDGPPLFLKRDGTVAVSVPGPASRRSHEHGARRALRHESGSDGAGGVSVGSGIRVDASGSSWGGYVDSQGHHVTDSWSVIPGEDGTGPTIIETVDDETAGVSTEYRTNPDGSWSSATLVDGKLVSETTGDPTTGWLSFTSVDSTTGNRTVTVTDEQGNVIAEHVEDSSGNVLETHDTIGDVRSDHSGKYTGNGYMKGYDDEGNQVSEWDISTDPDTGVTTVWSWNVWGDTSLEVHDADGNVLFQTITSVDAAGVITRTTKNPDGSTETAVTDPKTGDTTVTHKSKGGEKTTTVYAGEPPEEENDDDDEEDDDGDTWFEEDDDGGYIPADFDDNRSDTKGSALNLGIGKGDPDPVEGGSDNEAGTLNWNLLTPDEGPMVGDLPPTDAGTVLDVNRLTDPSSDDDPRGDGSGGGGLRPTGGWVSFPLPAGPVQAAQAHVSVTAGGFALKGLGRAS